jgi:hypothetical protein
MLIISAIILGVLGGLLVGIVVICHREGIIQLQQEEDLRQFQNKIDQRKALDHAELWEAYLDLLKENETLIKQLDNWRCG